MRTLNKTNPFFFKHFNYYLKNIIIISFIVQSIPILIALSAVSFLGERDDGPVGYFRYSTAV